MATPATVDPIAPASVAIDVEVPAPSTTAEASSDVAIAADSAEAPHTTTPAVASTTPQNKPDASKSKAELSKKQHRQSSARDGYNIVCCGNSWLDLFLIPLTVVVLFGAMIGLSILVLWSVFLTSTSGAAHWVFFFAWITGVIAVVISVQVAEYEKYLNAEHEKKQIAEGTNA
ncbi:hypothetical protein H310_09471 [Aphanomyces invadans]|uniref:Uncharacterized protein n=1 Tax=Aphanomyces invadans TaxID=157072 RepID=A0A024TW39_9STRA|nr:hypothetical protein H310_09471 [Aphanomyces invadans]ETV97567.1 hypothetical protein H310_09471 [Aphanomyces invadans]|eukprot:XP_008873776.1 hypothetical protein H310_09471 [Aphanomyces invadans]